MVHKLIKAAVAAAMSAGLVLASGCLTRPVVSESPTTKTAFQAAVKQQNIDKIDLLFAIDNSASMGDKQQLLSLAVPILVTRLLNPNCVSTDTSLTCKMASDCTAALGGTAQCDVYGNSGNGQCYVPGDNQGVNQCKAINNTKAEFPPVHDMHIGIITSSLGAGGSPDICVPPSMDTTHQDDHGYLINRTYNSGTNTEGPGINNAKPVDGTGGNFLAWLPASFPQNMGKTPPNVTPYGDGEATQLITDFQSLVTGVQQHGCGLEAQLESWYRFLITPDPWQSITTTSDSPPKAQYMGVDATLLKMRHDFLRPDSLVAIIQLTDEEDSWSDPLWLGGYGWLARTSATNDFGGPGQGAGPQGTSECDQPVDVNNPDFTGPNSPDCVSCAFQGNKPACPATAPAGSCPNAGQAVSADMNCMSCAGGTTGCPKPGWYTPASASVPYGAADGVNVRYSRQIMRQKYGFDNQHNYHRYVDGLQSTTVPDLESESHGGGGGYEGDNSQYAPNRDCTNPLFAQNLPDGSDTSHNALCTLMPGSRTPDLVFYAIIGGVPPDLLLDMNGNFKLNLGASDWQSILGKDPDHYIFDGMDPRMVQSTGPRCSGTSCPASMQPVPGTFNNGTNGFREWNTLTSSAAIDLQYACTFLLPAEKDCNAAANVGACDCTGTTTSDPGGTPLCDPVTRTTQKYGKSYPQSRYQLVAKALGSQAVVASICAQDTNPADEALPAFGYNGAMQAIVNRLKAALGGQCLPQQLQAGSDGSVPCTILIEYTSQTQTGSPGNYTDPTSACTDPGMSIPPADVISRFDTNYAATLGDAGASMPPPVVCQFQQLLPANLATTAPPNTTFTGNTCENQPNPGWCYVVGAANTGGCPQAIKFGAAGPPAGTVVSLECIEQRGGTDAGGGGG